jgi:N-acetylglucosamine-6-phosphate deacetylase
MIQLYGWLYAPEDRGLSLVTVKDGRIARIEPSGRPTPGCLGGPASRILPGLLDIQINGAFGADFGDPGADMGRICRSLPRFGVTGFVPTVVTARPEAYAPALVNLRRRPGPGEARVLGVHLEGPFISPKHPGAHDPALLRLPSIDEAAAWLEAGDVRYVTLAPELPGALELTRFLTGHGVRVSMGHSDASWDEARAGAEAGIGLGTHVFNAMRPLHHRDPGLVGYLLATHLSVGFIGDGNHLAFEAVGLLARIKAPDELVLVTDALAGLGMPPGRYRLAGGEYVSDGTCGRLPDGTLSGSLLPLNRAIRHLVESAGLEPSLAVRLATLNAARVLGLDGSLGRIEIGRLADIALVDERWEAQATLVDGMVAYSVEPAAASARSGLAER